MSTLREAFAGLGLQSDYHTIVEAIRATHPFGSTGATNQMANRHRERRARAAERLAFYRDDVSTAIAKLIDEVYAHPTVRTDRARMARMIGFANIPKRITDEVASLYSLPARRRFADDDRAVEFGKVERELDLHSVMRQAHRLCFLLNNVLLWHLDQDGQRSLRIITPDSFDVIPHPRNPIELLAVVVDCAPAWTPPAIVDRSSLVHYQVWDAEIRIDLDAHGKIVSEPVAHGLGRIPGVLMSSHMPTHSLLDDSPGEDIFQAARAVLFLNLCLLSLSRDASERQPYLQGALAEMAANQPQIAGRPLQLPPGVEVGTLDLVTDPEHLLKVLHHVVSSVAQSYGMSYEQFTLQETASTASGKAYTVRRERLIELRREQRLRAIRHEQDVATLLGFGDALTPDFAEVEVPADPIEELDVFDRRCNRGLDNPVSYLLRKDPDLSPEQARDRFVDNVTVTSWLFTLLRTMNLSLTATAENPGQSPEQNGAMAHPSPGATGAATRSETEGNDTATAA